MDPFVLFWRQGTFGVGSYQNEYTIYVTHINILMEYFGLLFSPEDGGNKFLRNVANFCYPTRSHILEHNALHY
jgi:hypothetical protein